MTCPTRTFTVILAVGKRRSGGSPLNRVPPRTPSDVTVSPYVAPDKEKVEGSAPEDKRAVIGIGGTTSPGTSEYDAAGADSKSVSGITLYVYRGDTCVEIPVDPVTTKDPPVDP
jgi:hypothetical protein